MGFVYPEVCEICERDFEKGNFSTKHGRVRCRFCGALYQVSPYMVTKEGGDAPVLLMKEEYVEPTKEFYDEHGVRYDRHRPLWKDYLEENYAKLEEKLEI